MMDRTQSTTFQAVEDWLRSLGLLHYAQKFYDNGYEDIDTCKLIKEEDLNAIDITIERDRQDILTAVIKLQQNIYFELEPDNNENITERTKIETIVLKTKLKECLEHDKVQLTEPPYYNKDGTVGDLYPLAIKYSSELGTFFNDVIDALEQLRKRQLPVQNYNEMAMAPPKDMSRDTELRRSLRTTSNPADYLNCETPEHAKKRSSSFSKFDTRVTKSTTDLTKDNIQTSDISPKGKSKKTKSRFGGVFKRGATTRQGNPGVASEFIASELKLSQNEIVGIMQKVKNKEISQEDALDVIKRGVTKSLSFDGNTAAPVHHPLVETNSIGFLLSKEAASAVKSKQKSLKSSGSMKGRTPTAQFYTREDDMAQSSTSLLSSDSRSSLEISGDHSGNNMDEDRLSISSKNSPEIGKHGIFKKIRNSMRKKKGENGDLEKDAFVPNGSPDNGGNQSDLLFNPTHPGSEVLENLPPKGPYSSPANRTITVPPPPCSTPPPPPEIDDSPIPSQQTEVEFRERKPSLKIKSYPQNQDEVSKRRSLEKNKNSSKTENEDSVSYSDRSVFTPINANSKLDSTFDVNQSISNPNKVIPQIPPRPVPRKSTSDSNNPIPTVPPRRSRIFRAESTDRHMDEIVKEMNEIAANLDQLNVEDVIEKPEFEADIKHSKKPSKTSTPGWKKPVPPPRPNVQKERLDDTSSLDSRSTSSLDSSKSNDGIQCQMRKVNKRNIRSIVSPKQLISKKLRKDVINLATAPYTSKDGYWRLPYNLITRYANELPYSVAEIIKYLDEIRIEDRKRINLPCIPYTDKDLCINKCIRPDYSLNEWLIHIGLPMFIEDFREAGISRLEELFELDANDIKYIGIFDDDHIKLLLNKVKTELL